MRIPPSSRLLRQSAAIRAAPRHAALPTALLRQPLSPSAALSHSTSTTPRTRFGRYSLVSPPSTTHAHHAHAHALSVPESIPRPDYATHPRGIAHLPAGVQVKSTRDVDAMRRAGCLAAEALRVAERSCVPGTTTASIDASVHAFIISRGAYPSPLGYYGFPRSVCTSVNNVMVHGIPDDSRPLLSGDIITVDVTVFLDGWHGDTAATFCVGDVDDAGRVLVEAARECRDKGIAVCGPGVRLGEIRRAVSRTASRHSLTVSPSFCGHGIGRAFHEAPLVYFHLPPLAHAHTAWTEHVHRTDQGEEQDGKKQEEEAYDDDETTLDDDLVLEPGMTFTVEPVVCQGSAKEVKWPDNWTVATLDGGRAAQFEHTILITEHGHEVLTL